MSRTTAANDLKRDIESYTCGETPSALELHRAPVIEQWSCEVRRVGKEFKMVVKGAVSKHPEYQDGEPIITPALVWFDRDDRFCRTHHRLYALGQPDVEYL